jgi:hypothetical protein
MRRRAAFVALLVALLSRPAAAGPMRAWPDDFVDRLKVLALIEELNGALLASRSATTTLDTWCAAHRMAKPARLTAALDRKATRQATPADRRILGVGPLEPIGYRRVALACGSHVLSNAENWYVPSRLTVSMNRTLETTDAPFGRAILDLHPTRQTLSVDRLWSPLLPDWDLSVPGRPSKGVIAIPADLFRHRAVVYDARHRPIALVVETYTRENLNF